MARSWSWDLNQILIPYQLSLETLIPLYGAQTQRGEAEDKEMN